MRRTAAPLARGSAVASGAAASTAPETHSAAAGTSVENAPTGVSPSQPRTRRFGEPSLKGRALRLLSLREHSRAELERKLREHDTEDGELARALDALQAKGFISDERVAESVVHHKGARFGAQRVRAELIAKGLDDTIVRAAIQSLRDSELDRARVVWRKKFGHPPADAQERAKQLRFLASRGFSGDVAHRVLGSCDEDDGL